MEIDIAHNMINFSYPYSDSDSKSEIIRNILNDMETYCNQRQLSELNKSLINRLKYVELINKELPFDEDYHKENERLLEEFLNTKKLEGKSPQTLGNYRSSVDKLCETIGKPVTSMTTKDIRHHLSIYQNRGVSMITADNQRRYLNSFFTYLVDEDYILRNPMKKIKKFKTPQQIKLPFTEGEIEKLRTGANNDLRLRTLIEFLLSTGCRIGEVEKLNKEDIDFRNRECLVFGKGQKYRVVYINEVSEIYLKKYLASRTDDNPALFISEDGRKVRWAKSGMERRIRDLGKRIGVKAHPHKFRRTMATKALKAGMPIEQIQVLLGHANLDTTQLYAIVDQEQVKFNHKKYIN